MRALTVRQPWAWAIVYGGKDVENRTRNVVGSYRGPVAIHAGREWSSDGEHSELVARAYFEARQRQGWTVVDKDGAPRRAAALGLGRFVLPDYFGAFIGIVDLVDVHDSRPALHAFDDVWQAGCCESPWAEYPGSEVRRLCEREPQWVSGGVHLVLAHPRPLRTPIPARGMLGLWTPPPVVLEQLQAVA